MKPPFSVLERNFSSARKVPQAALFSELGWTDLVGKPAWENTCAIRLSLALIRSGISIPGRMAIKSGKYQGRMIEPGHVRLSKILSQRPFLGAPEKIKGKDPQGVIGTRRGIVSFFDVNPLVQTPQGHIDIVAPNHNMLDCGTSCFWLANEIWFWPLSG